MSDEYWRSAVDWIEVEHRMYEDVKFPDHELDDSKLPDQWAQAINMYLHRAQTLGLDNPLGRQAAGKAATTAVAFLESIFRQYGQIPVPGFPSGEVRGEFKIG